MSQRNVSSSTSHIRGSTAMGSKPSSTSLSTSASTTAVGGTTSNTSSSTSVSLATYGKLDLTAIESATQLWLAHLPPKLAAVVDMAPEGTFLGTLTFTKGGVLAGDVVKEENMTDSNIDNCSSNNNNKGISEGNRMSHKNNNNDTSTRKNVQVPQKLSIQISPELEDNVMKKNSSASTLLPLASAVPTEILPLDYTLTNITTQIPASAMHPFTRHPTNGSISLHGTIVRTCQVQMERTDRYRDMCKARIYNLAAMGSSATSDVSNTGSHTTGTLVDNKRRFVQPIESIHSVAKLDMLQSSNAVRMASSNTTSGINQKNVIMAGSKGSGFGDSVAQFGKRLRLAQQDYTQQQQQQQFLAQSSSSSASRKRPLSFTQESSVRSILFELFSRQTHWTMKDLRVASGGVKTEKEIRNELLVIAEYVRAGEHKGMWQLKSEFKGSSNNENVDHSAAGTN